MAAVVLSQNVPRGERHWNPLGPKQKSALELYDELREKAGLDTWDVVHHLKNNGELGLSRRRAPFAGNSNSLASFAGTADQSHSFQVQPHKTTHANVHFPRINLFPPPGADKEEREDWNTSLSEFQEWLGLACMGSQR